MVKNKSEYLLYEENKNLIGKRAKFNKKLEYIKKVWGKTGKIINHKGSLYLSLLFDEPLRYGYENSCITKSLFIMPDSIDLI